MTPLARVSGISGGTDRILVVEVNDQEGNRADSCRVEIDDRDGRVAIPSRGQNISITMGYREGGMQNMGSFIVDEVTASGWPQKITILGRSADLTQELKSPRSFSYKNQSISQIVQQIAGRHGLSGSASGAIGSQQYQHLAQTEESDMNFLTRLAMRHDALFAIKNGQLIFKKRGETMGGSARVVHPGNVLEYKVTYQERQAHGEGQGEWWDRKQAKRTRESGSGGSGSATSMATPMAEDGQQQATDTAGSTGSSHMRSEKVGEFTIIGDPSVRAEMSLSVSGIKGGVDGGYRIKAVTHQLSNQGYRTTIQAEASG